MSNVSREQMLAHKPRAVELEAFGGVVRVRNLSLKDRLALLDASTTNQDAHAAYVADQKLPPAERKGVAQVVRYDDLILQMIFQIVDEAGERLYGLADYDALAELDYDEFRRLWQAYSQSKAPAETDPKKA